MTTTWRAAAAALVAGALVGMVALAFAAGQGEDAPGRAQHVAVLICHKAGDKVVPIVTDDDAVKAHEAHGDEIITENVPAPSDKAAQREACGVGGQNGGNEEAPSEGEVAENVLTG